MTVTPRDIEKLKAIGYKAVGLSGSEVFRSPDKFFVGVEAWSKAKTHAKSGGLKATMADKVRWLGYLQLFWSGNQRAPSWDGWLAEGEGGREAIADSPEAAVDALFWKVP